MASKTIINPVLAFFLLFFICGCASNKITIQDYSPMAIFSMSSNVSVGWQNDGFNKDENIKTGGVLSDQLNKLVDKNNPEHFTSAQRLLYADTAFHEKLYELAGIELIDKETFLSSDTYLDQAASAFAYMESRDFLDGYKRIQSIGRKKARLIMQELGLKGMLRVDFNFEKKLLRGNKWNGEVTAIAEMKVYIINSRGKESRPIVLTQQSPVRIQISNRKYDQQALVDLFPDLIDSLVANFVMKYL